MFAVGWFRAETAPSACATSAAAITTTPTIRIVTARRGRLAFRARTTAGRSIHPPLTTGTMGAGWSPPPAPELGDDSAPGAVQCQDGAPPGSTEPARASRRPER